MESELPLPARPPLRRISVESYGALLGGARTFLSADIIDSSKAVEGRRTPRRYRANDCPFQFVGHEQVRKELGNTGEGAPITINVKV